MGYTTTFSGVLVLDRPLEPAHWDFLRRFSQTRRMKREPHLLESEFDPARVLADLPLDEDGANYVGSPSRLGEDVEHPSVIDAHAPPSGQPNLWCHWTPTEDATALEWDADSSFCDYVEWLDYLLEHFLTPWGYRLSGQITWQGEFDDDRGTLLISHGKVRALSDRSVEEDYAEFEASSFTSMRPAG
jgi:hypothetical protein